MFNYQNLKEKFDAYLADFNAEYPNIKVNHNTDIGGYDQVRDQTATELSVGAGPDVVYCYADHVALYNKTKKVVALDKYIDDEEIGLTDEQYNDFIPGYLNEGKQFGDGKMYMMAPPNRRHQKLVSELHYKISDYIRKKQEACEIYPAPFAVFLSEDNQNYVEPDIYPRLHRYALLNLPLQNVLWKY